MRVLVTGAAGFVGQALVRHLLDSVPDLEELVLSDLNCAGVGGADPRVRRVEGSIADRDVLGRACEKPLDQVFHLASIPGGAAEVNYELGRDVNILATLAMLDLLRQMPKPPVFVFASSIAVFGALPDLVDDDTPLHPQLSYGAQKVIGEVLVADFSRRGWIDGRSVRLPGILARPPQRSGQISIFLSDIIRDLPQRQPVQCPVSADGKTWIMSVTRCVENLLHAARMILPANAPRRTFTLPPLLVSIGDMVETVGRLSGADGSGLVTYTPNPIIQANFAAYPPVSLPEAEKVGFRSDTDLAALVQNCWDHDRRMN